MREPLPLLAYGGAAVLLWFNGGPLQIPRAAMGTWEDQEARRRIQTVSHYTGMYFILYANLFFVFPSLPPPPSDPYFFVGEGVCDLQGLALR